ncbi:MAG: nucleotidyltransferase domain-containing protein [Magnetococcales bacterium]|nr:nucleotidyltransferase domain-containing protein [Magnetococcales bacterium]
MGPSPIIHVCRVGTHEPEHRPSASHAFNAERGACTPGDGIDVSERDPDALALRPRHREMVGAILLQVASRAEVWAYGSRVTGRHEEASDLDLVVRRVAEGVRSGQVVGRLKAAFEESDLPIQVDVLDWDLLPDSFREEILGNYCVVSGPLHGWGPS